MNTWVESTIHKACALHGYELHKQAIVIDTHCDTTQRLLNPQWDFATRDPIGHVDLPRLREGGVNAVFLAVWTPQPTQVGESSRAARTQLARIHQVVQEHHLDLQLARTADDIRLAKQNGKIAILIGIEGGHLIEDSLDLLHEYHDQGATYLTLTHAFHTNWADSAGVHEDLPSRHHGLTELGREVIHELNRLGMIVDVSHVSDKTFWDVMETSSAPVVATHSSCRAVAQHRRNLTDDMMRAIAQSGGVLQINFAALFIDEAHPDLPPALVERWFAAQERDEALCKPLTDYQTPLSKLIDHFEHAIKTIGADHVGIGSDFDGVPALPAGMEDCSKLPNLTAKLLERGIHEEAVTKILGQNVLRVMERVQQAATTANA